MKKPKAIYLYTLIWGALFLLLGLNIVVWGRDELFIRGYSQWLDYPVHLAFSRAMEGKWPWEIFKSHPYFSWTPFNYYFLPDLFVTWLMQLKLRFDLAIILPSVFAFVVFIYAKFRFLLRRNFLIREILFSDILFLFWGGYGFILFHFYSNEFGYLNNFELSNFYLNHGTLLSSYYSNPLNGQLFSSKNILFGLAFFFSCLNFLDKKLYKILFVTLLFFPFIHAHSFLLFMIWWALGLILDRKTTQRRDWYWLIFSSLICLVVLKMTLLRYSGQGFIEWRFGWRSSPFSFETYKVLFLGTGFFWPFVLWAFYKNHKNRFLRYIFCFCLVTLFMTHFIQWQPNIWDNIKLYNFAHLFGGICLAFWLGKKSWGVASFIVLFLSLNALIETYYIHFTDRHQYPLLSRSDFKLAEDFSKKYENGKVLYENYHNHWYPILDGKNIAFGFLYNLWTWGVPYQTYLKKLAPVLKGQGGVQEHRKLGIHYVIASKKDFIYPPAEELLAEPYFMTGPGLSLPKLSERYPRWYYPRKAKNVMPLFYVGTGEFPNVDIPHYRISFPVLLENEDWVIFDVSKNKLEGK